MSRDTKPQKSYPVGRVCAAKGCTTRLNRYNKDEICAPCDEACTSDDEILEVTEQWSRWAEGEEVVMIG